MTTAASPGPDLPKKTWISRVRGFLGDHIEVVLQFVQVAAIVIGGLAFLYQYNANIDKDKKQETPKYAAKSYEDRILHDMAILAKPLTDLR